MQHTCNLARTNFDVIVGEEKKVLSAPCALYHCVLNYAKPTKGSDISIENPASVWIFGSLLINPQSRPKSDGTRDFAQGGK